MGLKKIYLIALFFYLLGLTKLQAQEAIPTAGGETSGSGGSSSYSVGQVLYNTHTGTAGSFTQGVQQPFEISVISGIEEAIGITYVVSAHPNPTTGFLRLTLGSYKIDNLCYQLYDINGILLENKDISANQVNIDMSSIVQGTYFLKLTDNQKEIKTFKIIKN